MCPSLNSLKFVALQTCSETAGSCEPWGNHTRFNLKLRLHKSVQLNTLNPLCLHMWV